MVNVTAKNYYEVIKKVGLNNLTQELIDDFHYIDESTEKNTNWDYYKTTPSVRAAIATMFIDVENYLKENPQLLSSGKKNVQSKPAAKKVSTQRNNTASAKPKKVKKSKRVGHIREEVKLIKRFVSFHNKVKTREHILALLKSLQRSITMKLISKTSPYVKEIRLIQDKLVYLYNNYKPKKIEINSSDLPRFVAIAGGEEVYPSINFMKRFISYQGKPIDSKTKERFLKQLQIAEEKKNVLEEDPYVDKLKEIYNYLNKTYKSGAKVNIYSTELNGLEGIVCSCQKQSKELGKLYDTKGLRVRRCRSGKYSDAGRGACSYNKGIDKALLGRIYDTNGKKVRRCKSGKYSDAGKGACSYNKGLAGVMTAEEISNQIYELLPFTGQWEELIGKPEKNFTMMIHGEPGGGKTVFLLQFVKYLCQFGKGLYVSSEEQGSFTLKKKIDKHLVPFPENIHFISHLTEMDLDNYDYSFAVFDSINDLGMNLEYFKELKRRNPNTAFILVLQHTKDGQFRGGKEWEHEVQIAGKVDKGLISIYKNRYGVYGNWQFDDYSQKTNLN